MTPDEHTNQEFFLDVGDGHKLYVHDWGNAKAEIPILFLHGGPGSGCNDGHKQNFDPGLHHVIFFDQRGSGKSLPFSSLEHNTTDHLVEDINKILKHLDIDKISLFGRSWGSTLALTYAIRNPKKIHSIITGGIYLGTQDEMAKEPANAALFYPDAWTNFLNKTPAQYHEQAVDYHLKQILGTDLEKAQDSAYVYSELVSPMLRLDDRRTPQDKETFNWEMMKIGAHYSVNDNFLADNYILENALKVTAPVWIVQGRYDIICPPKSAYLLHKALPKSHLIFTLAGHANSDRPIYDTTRTILLNGAVYG